MICATVRENLPLLLHGFAVSIYPRKGTVTMGQIQIAQATPVSIYPRKGTVTYAAFLLSCLPSFNLSPQGDGNIPLRLATYSFHVSIYPRKGTVTMGQIQIAQATPVSIYPRKGTVTYAAFLLSCLPSFNLSPQGDGNIPLRLATYSFHVSIYPRKGTVTEVIGTSGITIHVSIYPRKGTVTRDTSFLREN